MALPYSCKNSQALSTLMNNPSVSITKISHTKLSEHRCIISQNPNSDSPITQPDAKLLIITPISCPFPPNLCPIPYHLLPITSSNNILTPYINKEQMPIQPYNTSEHYICVSDYIDEFKFLAEEHYANMQKMKPKRINDMGTIFSLIKDLQVITNALRDIEQRLSSI